MGIDYILTRSKRKTAAIRVSENGVEVRAPLKMPRREIDGFVSSKEKWIKEKLALLKSRAESKNAFALNYGDTILILGKDYPLIRRDGKITGLEGETVYLPPGLPPEDIKENCIGLYRELAKVNFKRRTAIFAERMGVKPVSVKINGAKTRWGSCSAKKTINFSWRLIIAENSVINYVIVHELAHLTEMNHSERFWKIVEGVVPDYKAQREKLRELQKRLSTENWD